MCLVLDLGTSKLKKFRFLLWEINFRSGQKVSTHNTTQAKVPHQTKWLKHEIFNFEPSSEFDCAIFGNFPTLSKSAAFYQPPNSELTSKMKYLTLVQTTPLQGICVLSCTLSRNRSDKYCGMQQICRICHLY